MVKHRKKLEEIIEYYSDKSYLEIYEYIQGKIKDGSLIPIAAQGNNGKKPALCNAYWEVSEEKDYTELLEELKFKISPMIDISYYMKNLRRYEKDRENILLLNEFLIMDRDRLKEETTVNERSFQIFHREKFLSKEGGAELLKRLGLSEKNLNIYNTSEPLSYYSHSKKSPQNLLIIENKDTFYSMRRHMERRNCSILGMDVGTVIYGGGKGIYKSFEDYENGVEEYFSDEKNVMWYFGDLDYEGILIYETLTEKYKTEIRLFANAYECMIKKALDIGISKLPDTKEGQNKNIGNIFLNYFESDYRTVIKDILEQGKYIPQEILNGEDY